MTSEELTQWFSEVLWPAYRQLVKTPYVTKFGAGSKGESLKKILTMKPSEKLRERIVMAIAAQTRHRKKTFDACGSMQAYLVKTKFNKFYANRMGSTYLNQMGWEDEIPDAMVVAAEVVQTDVCTCARMDCTEPTHGPGFSVCCGHLGRTNDAALKTQLVKMNMRKLVSESVSEYAARCRERFRTELRKTR